MFFNQVSLSKKSWHYRLQDWTFGNVPYTNNFCPFFWLTIFCLLALPFTGGYRGTKWLAINILELSCFLVDNTFGRLANLFDKYLCIPWYKHQVTSRANGMDDESAYDLLNYIFSVPFFCFDNDYDDPKINDDERNENTHFYGSSSKRKRRYHDQWKRWKTKNEDWQERLLVIRKRRQEIRKANEAYRKEQEEAAKKAEINRKKLMAALVKYTKYVGVAIVAAVGCGAVYLLAMLTHTIYDCWGGITAWLWSAIWTIGAALWWVAPYAGLIILGILVLVGLVVLLYTLIDKCNITIPVPKVFGRIGNSIEEVAEFFFTFAKAFKEDNCPAIEWEEEQ